MANKKEHRSFGAGAGAILAVLVSRPENLGQALVAGVTGAISGATGAALPDMLEPATSSHHRKTFHSLTCGGLVAYGTTYGAKACAKTSPFEERLVRAAGVSAGVGYLSHLALDARTSRGLPLV